MGYPSYLRSGGAYDAISTSVERDLMNILIEEKHKIRLEFVESCVTIALLLAALIHFGQYFDGFGRFSAVRRRV